MVRPGFVCVCLFSVLPIALMYIECNVHCRGGQNDQSKCCLCLFIGLFSVLPIALSYYCTTVQCTIECNVHCRGRHNGRSWSREKRTLPSCHRELLGRGSSISSSQTSSSPVSLGRSLMNRSRYLIMCALQFDFFVQNSTRADGPNY